MSLGLLEELLREPATLATRCREARDLRPLAATSLLAIALGGAAFGAAVGAYRGGAQIALAAAKIPIATLAALALAAPAFATLAAALGRVLPVRATVALCVAAGARASLVLFAFAPALWLVIAYGADYHLVKLCAAFGYALAGLSALSFVVHGLEAGPGRVGTIACFVGVFLVTGGQSAWLLRPYIGDPRDSAVPVIATGVEGGGVAGAIVRSLRRFGARE